MSNDAEHRAAFGLQPGCDLTAGGIKKIAIVGTGSVGKNTFAKDFINQDIILVDDLKKSAPKQDLLPIKKYIEYGGGTFYEQLSEDMIKANEQGHTIIFSIGKGAGKKFMHETLKAKAAQNQMPCPECAMKCEKTREGRIPGNKSKYEFFYCTECKKHFKITL